MRGLDNALWYGIVGGVTTWKSLGGKLSSGVASVNIGNDAYIFGRGTDKAIWYRTLTKDWASLGGILTSSPAATVSNGIIGVLARGGDTAAWFITLNTATGALGTWTSLGGKSN